MDFIDNVDSKLTTKRRELNVLADLSHIVHAGVGRAINFDDINRVPLCDLAAVLAGVAGTTCRSPFAVECLRENSRHGRFPHASRAGK